MAGAESVNIISQFDPPGRSDNTDMIMTSQQYFDQSQLLESSTPYTDAIRVRKYLAMKATADDFYPLMCFAKICFEGKLNHFR